MLISEKELCARLQVDRSFLYLCRKKGMPFIRLGTKLIRYDFDEVVSWLRQNSCTNEKK